MFIASAVNPESHGYHYLAYLYRYVRRHIMDHSQYRLSGERDRVLYSTIQENNATNLHITLVETTAWGQVSHSTIPENNATNLHITRWKRQQGTRYRTA